MPTPFTQLDDTQKVDRYLAMLRRDLKDGLITQTEYQDTLALVKPQAKIKTSLSITIEEATPDDDLVHRLEDLYYRELFGRKKSSKDHTLETEVLIGKDQHRLAAALWYAIEPTREYKKCVYLDMLYVGNDYRKTGISTKLLLNLLAHTPEDHSIITYAWKPVIDFYRRHGFLSTDEESIKVGQSFLKMVLPLTKSSFERYCREKADVGNYFDAYDELITEDDPIFNPEYLSHFVDAVASLTPEQEQDFSQNPFTALLYHRAKQPHILLPSHLQK